MPKFDFIKIALHFIEITLRHECSSVNLLYIFRAPFYKNTSGGLLLNVRASLNISHKKMDVHKKTVCKIHVTLLKVIQVADFNPF